MTEASSASPGRSSESTFGVLLMTFGAMMVATNVFNDALRVDLDGYLQPYRRGAA